MLEVTSFVIPPTSTSHQYFVEECGNTRILHSFPTRRSSDLGVPDEAPLGIVLERGVAGRMKSDARPPPQKERCGKRQDRKSTRLNSSHPSNSYAVCCSKKKVGQRQL